MPPLPPSLGRGSAIPHFIASRPPAAGGIGCVLLGYEDSCSLESSGSSGTRDAEPSDPPTPQPAPGDLGTAGGMLLDLAVKRPVVRSKIKVTARNPVFSSPVMGRPHLEGRAQLLAGTLGDNSPLGSLCWR